MDIVKEVENLEQQIYDAMRNGDVSVIERLIADDMLFTAHTGQVFTKEMDIQAYKAGIIKVDSVTPSEQVIKVVNDHTAAVSVLLEISGVFGGQPASGKFRFMRVWLKKENSWQAVVGQSTMLTA
jgi:ketosteroid isomerase-like protein